MPATATLSRAATLMVLATLSAGASTAAAAEPTATGELISRASGVDGAPITDAVVTLDTATRNGRFVAFDAGRWDSTTLTYAYTSYLRDRVAHTTTQLLAPPGDHKVLDVSEDGSRVLYGLASTTPDGRATNVLYVLDRTTGRTSPAAGAPTISYASLW